MINRQGKHVIPNEALKPLIEKWMARNEFWAENYMGWIREKGVTRLSEMSDVPQRKIHAIITGNSITNTKKGKTYKAISVSFEVADRLLCAMDMTEEWFLSLAEHYSDEKGEEEMAA